MATLKMVLDGVELNVNGQDATGFAKYYCDGVSGNQMDILNNAANSVPYGVGDKFPVVAQGGPSIRIGGSDPGAIPIGVQSATKRTQHQLRVMQKRAFLTNNAKKVWVELGLRSPPAVAESSGAALIQKRNEFYLTGPNNSPQRKQIVITYYILPGTFGPNTPATLIKMPQRPSTCSKYFYTESFRSSGTFFFDELPSAGFLQKLKQMFAGRINGGVFLYKDGQANGNVGDARQWLCTNVETDSPDNGMTYRITAEWTYNIEFWDPVIVLTDAHGQPVKIDPSYFSRLQESLASGAHGRLFNNGSNGNIPTPITEAGAGWGRFPIYQSADMASLLAFIRKEIPASGLRF